MLEKQGRDIERINRGLYGDSDNKLPGLIERQIEDERRIDKLEKHHERQKWYLGGIGVSALVAWEFISDHIKSFFK